MLSPSQRAFLVLRKDSWHWGMKPAGPQHFSLCFSFYRIVVAQSKAWIHHRDFSLWLCYCLRNPLREKGRHGMASCHNTPSTLAYFQSRRGNFFALSLWEFWDSHVPILAISSGKKIISKPPLCKQEEWGLSMVFSLSKWTNQSCLQKTSKPCVLFWREIKDPSDVDFSGTNLFYFPWGHA